MKLLCYSDLHLEFPAALAHFKIPEGLDFDAVVLAGDIHKHTQGLKWAQETFPNKQVIYVMGNHEAYGAHLFGLIAEMRRRAKDHGIAFLECEEWTDPVHHVRFLGCTLWTNFQIRGIDSAHFCMKEAARSMPDFSCIRIGPSKSALSVEGYDPMLSGILKPSDTVKIFNRSKSWLAQKLDEPFDGKTVVVTHHLPSWRLCAEKFQDDPLTAAFISHLDHLVEKADLWIAGHTHDSFDIKIGNCRVIVNPRGYPDTKKNTIENRRFQDGLVVEI